MFGKIYALVTPDGVRAVVFENGEALHMLTHDKPNQPENAVGLHVGMFLQPALTKLIKRNPGPYPYKKIYLYMDLTYRLNTVVDMFYSSMDRRFTLYTRKVCAETAEAVINKSVEKRLTTFFLKQGLPPETDPTHGPKNGIAGEILRKMLEPRQ